MAQTLLNVLSDPDNPFELQMFYGDTDVWRYYIDPETGQQFLQNFQDGKFLGTKLEILSFNPDFEGGNAIKFRTVEENEDEEEEYIIKWNPEEEFGGNQGYQGISRIKPENGDRYQ